MAKNGHEMNGDKKVSEETLRDMLKNQRIANAAVRKAQEENRRLGIPNWYSINGVIVSDQEIEERSKVKK